MKFAGISILTVFFSFIVMQGLAQVTSIPKEAVENFARQYPTATEAKWDNDIVNVNVHFTLDGEKMNAEYTNKGIWKRTLKDWTFDKLPAAVQDGFRKSKYAERSVTDVKVLYQPGSTEQFRLKVEKNDVQKKFLYFNPSGRLIRDSNTL